MYLCAVNNILAEIMPRQERLHSATGIYHVMLRGINKQDIFEDDEDHSQFLKWIMRTVPKFLKDTPFNFNLNLGLRFSFK